MISLLEEQREVKQKGASMRLGTWLTHVTPGTKAADLYKSDTISERHRHRYEYNEKYRKRMEDKGLIVAGVSPDLWFLSPASLVS